MIGILTWVSIATGGLLILLMLLSLLGGLDLDFDIGDADVDTDLDSSGSLGLLKSLLTFVSVSTWVMKILMTMESSVYVVLIVGLVSGLVAVVLFTWLFRLLLKNQENVNWSLDDSLFKEGKVYLKIPSGEKSGLVHVELNGAVRELKAVSSDGEVIETGSVVLVEQTKGNMVIVSKI